MSKKIGILTGGGDCGGLNAAIEAVVKSARNLGWGVYGIRRGWEGLVFGNMFPLDVPYVDGIHSHTGTVLQTSRTNPFKFSGKLDGRTMDKEDVSAQVVKNIGNSGLEAIIACGGDDTLGVIPNLICRYGNSLPTTFVGVPKTMDGDLQRYSLGLDTAINRAKQVLEDFKPILKANGSIGIVELFGRDVGRVTFKAGIASGADVILIPEVPVDLGYTCDFIADKYNKRAGNNNGISYVLIAVAEGTNHPLTGEQVYQNTGADSFGHGKLGDVSGVLAKLIYERLKNDPRIKRHTRQLDIKTEKPTYHVRGGKTSYYDSYVGQKLGLAAIKYIKEGAESGMAVVNFNEYGEVELMSISQLVEPRVVSPVALGLFGNSGLYCFGRRPEELAANNYALIQNRVA